MKVGVKSAAILLGDYAGPVCFALSMMFVSMLAYAGVLNGQSPYYFIISVGGTAAHIIYQYVLVDLQVPTSCGRKYSIQCFRDCWLCRFIFRLATDGDCLNHRVLRHERPHGHHHLVGYVGRLPRQDRCHPSPQTLDTLTYLDVPYPRLPLVPSALPPAGLPRKYLSTVCTFWMLLYIQPCAHIMSCNGNANGHSTRGTLLRSKSRVSVSLSLHVRGYDVPKWRL